MDLTASRKQVADQVNLLMKRNNSDPDPETADDEDAEYEDQADEHGGEQDTDDAADGQSTDDSDDERAEDDGDNYQGEEESEYDESEDDTDEEPQADEDAEHGDDGTPDEEDAGESAEEFVPAVDRFVDACGWFDADFITAVIEELGAEDLGANERKKVFAAATAVSAALRKIIAAAATR